MKRIFQQSISNKEKIIIFYIDNENNITQRFIRVLKMNDGVILAYCFWRKKVRTFKLENILSAGSLKQKVGA